MNGRGYMKDDLQVGQAYESSCGMVYVVLEPFAAAGRGGGWKALVLVRGNFTSEWASEGTVIDVLKTSLFHWEARRL